MRSMASNDFSMLTESSETTIFNTAFVLINDDPFILS